MSKHRLQKKRVTDYDPQQLSLIFLISKMRIIMYNLQGRLLWDVASKIKYAHPSGWKKFLYMCVCVMHYNFTYKYIYLYTTLLYVWIEPGAIVRPTC